MLYYEYWKEEGRDDTMQAKQLSIGEVLKYARHDFLNDLQVILMNIDMKNTTRAREVILATTDKLKQHSMLSSLNLPETAFWLSTFEWMYASFSKRLSCHIESPILGVDEETLLSSLRQIVANVNEHVNIYSSYEVLIDVCANEADWEISFAFHGKLPANVGKTIESPTFLIEESLQENLWTFTIRGR